MQKWDDERQALKDKEEELDQLSYKQKAKYRKNKANEEKEKKKKELKQGASLGIDKIVIVDPKYYKINTRKNGLIDLKQSELHRLRYNERIDKCVQASSLNVDVLSSKNLHTNSVAKFNDLALLNEWMEERVGFELDYDFVPYSGYYTDRISNQYNTDYFLWTGVFAERKRKDVAFAVGASILFTYGLTLPFVIVWATIPNYKVYYYSLLFNVKTGEKQLIVLDDYKGSDLSGDFVKSSLYDTFYQIKKH
jgi:hypothetical protein